MKNIIDISKIQPLVKQLIVSFLMVLYLKPIPKKYNFSPEIMALDLKPKTHADVAKEYGVTPRTMHRRYKKAKLNIPSGRIGALHLMIIYSVLGFLKI
jgi:hypothetical protein